MSVKERIKLLAKTKERSVTAFEEKTGLNKGYVNAIRVSIQPDKLEKIRQAYPDLNTEWLLTGEGEMLKPNTDSSGEYFIESYNRLTATMENISETNRLLSESNKLLAEANNKLVENNTMVIESLIGIAENINREITLLSAARRGNSA